MPATLIRPTVVFDVDGRKITFGIVSHRVRMRQRWWRQLGRLGTCRQLLLELISRLILGEEMWVYGDADGDDVTCFRGRI